MTAASSGSRLHRMVERIGDFQGLDSSDAVLRPQIRRLRHTPAWPMLRGRWLGHALHPMLTDVPIGFWSSAVVLDLVGGEATDAGADRLIALGALATIPTAAAGMADWSEASLKARRQGLVHASANTVALVCFLASLASRRTNRARGKRLALLGEAALLAGGYIGGHLTYAEGVSVDARAAVEPADPDAPRSSAGPL